MAYCTTPEVKTYLGITGTSDDALIEALIARAQKMIEGTCRRVFEASGNTVRKFDAVADVEDAVLHLDGDLCSIASITNGDGTIILPADYVTEPRNATPYHAIRLLESSGRTWTYLADPENAIEVNGQWAFSATVPESVKQLCIEVAAALYRQRANPAGDHTVDVQAYLKGRAAALGLVRVG